jgi:phosphatidylethanolamine/phosphatidyl-N-methylethanolamine N-methyltransferase
MGLQLTLKESRHFIHLVHFFKNLKKTGAIAPSSKFLAKDLLEPLIDTLNHQPEKPLNLLEIGPGTGPLTKRLATLIRPQDQLDIVEINEAFHQYIHNRFSSQNISVHHTDFLEFDPGKQYDFIFSSLPYESLPTPVSQAIWKKKLELCREEGTYISYYKYLQFNAFKCDFERQVVDKYQTNKKLVWLNLPPAQCFTLQVANGTLS